MTSINRPNSQEQPLPSSSSHDKWSGDRTLGEGEKQINNSRLVGTGRAALLPERSAVNSSATSEEEAPKAESSSSEPLSFSELRKLFRGISNNLDSNETADRHQVLGWSEKFPCREEFGSAARMLDSLVVTMQFGDERSTEPLLQETFNPDLSLEDNLQRAVDYQTEELKRHLDGRNSDGRRYPAPVVNYPGLTTALFAQKLYEVCTENRFT